MKHKKTAKSSRVTVQTAPEVDDRWLFLRAKEGDNMTDNASDARLSLMAACVANQQRFAGFKSVIDIREAQCPDCKAPGFNTGMGVWLFTCGAEILSGGTPDVPCGNEGRNTEPPASSLATAILRPPTSA